MVFQTTQPRRAQSVQAPSGLLSELPKALVLESVAFVANAPPRDGLLELVPLSGEGLITPFAVNTFGWTDEAESGGNGCFFFWWW